MPTHDPTPVKRLRQPKVRETSRDIAVAGRHADQTCYDAEAIADHRSLRDPAAIVIERLASQQS